MKFARYLNDNLVPEWRVQYLDYKGGKKRLKKLKKLQESGSGSGRLGARRATISSNASKSPRNTNVDAATRKSSDSSGSIDYAPSLPPSAVTTSGIRGNTLASVSDNDARSRALVDGRITPHQLLNTTGAIAIPNAQKDTGFNGDNDALLQYGSLIATPPSRDEAGMFSLPPPALNENVPRSPSSKAQPDSQQSVEDPVKVDSRQKRSDSELPAPPRSVTFSADPTIEHAPSPLGLGAPALQSPILQIRNRLDSNTQGLPASNIQGTPRSERSILKKTSKYSGIPPFSSQSAPTAQPQGNGQENSPSSPFFQPRRKKAMTEAMLRASTEEANRKIAEDADVRDFIYWLDGQFDKIQVFYRKKETEAISRFDKMREQLHLLRDQKMADRQKAVQDGEALQQQPRSLDKPKKKTMAEKYMSRWSAFYRRLDLHQLPFFPAQSGGGNTQQATTANEQRDYTIRQATNTVPYSIARRKLKHAMMEYYRGLELLKSYRLLNRTALQKICKKLDKTAATHISPWYMNKVENSYFGQSSVVDDLMNETEDVYSRYFERGNRKHAVEKLRTREIPESHYGATFFSALCLGIGLPFFVEAIVTGVQKALKNELANAVFLFQIFGGAFLVILFGILFSVNCMVWSRYKINYPFIFEFHQHDFLDFREFLEIPSFMFAWLSLCMYLCFYDFWPDKLPAHWWPLIFAGSATAILFNPFPVFHWRAREWLAIALWRLFFSGLYPVEFRDFFLGDIFCSLTYTVSNIELFFCLYARGFDAGPSCGSSKSRLMGFLNALPPIWRFLQCWRRYADTRNWFPHLANAGKYTFTIVTAVVLSIWRLDRIRTKRDVYILFATINLIYSTFWDLFMDWSLFQANTRNAFLRDELGFRNPSFYYVAMILDPLLRLNWIFYVIFPVQIQQSAVTSFLIALAEIVRRFLWIFFRMENEHCTNVGRFQASRNMPLPYDLDEEEEAGGGLSTNGLGHELTEINVTTPLMTAEEGRMSIIDDEEMMLDSPTGTPAAGGAGSGAATAMSSPSVGGASLRRRRSSIMMTPRMNAMSNMFRGAHAQDFERRKKRTRNQTVSEHHHQRHAGSIAGSIRSRAGSIIAHDEDNDAFSEDDDGDDDDVDDYEYGNETEGAEQSASSDEDSVGDVSPMTKPMRM